MNSDGGQELLRYILPDVQLCCLVDPILEMHLLKSAWPWSQMDLVKCYALFQPIWLHIVGYYSQCLHVTRMNQGYITRLWILAFLNSHNFHKSADLRVSLQDATPFIFQLLCLLTLLHIMNWDWFSALVPIGTRLLA
jgi:hypothetical protein